MTTPVLGRMSESTQAQPQRRETLQMLPVQLLLQTIRSPAAAHEEDAQGNIKIVKKTLDPIILNRPSFLFLFLFSHQHADRK